MLETIYIFFSSRRGNSIYCNKNRNEFKMLTKNKDNYEYVMECI